MKKNALRIVALVLSVIMTLGAMTVVSFADGEDVAEYRYETTAKRFATKRHTVKYPWANLEGQPGLLVGYGFDAVTNPTSVTIDLVVDIDPNNPGDAPGFHWTRVMLYNADGNVAWYLDAENGGGFVSDQYGKFSITMSISEASITGNGTVDRIDLCWITNRFATFAVESVKFDNIPAQNFGIISTTEVAKATDHTNCITDGVGQTFSFDTPVDMSDENELTYYKAYMDTDTVDGTEKPGLHKSRLALTDANGKIYSMNILATDNGNHFKNAAEFGDKYTVNISADHAANIGFDLSKVVQVDMYFAVNKLCAVKVSGLEIGGKRLLSSNSDLYYGDPDADLAISAQGSYLAYASGTYEFNAVDVTEFSKLKVNFTPINKSVVNSKISDGPYMWKLAYTLTSSTGASIEIKSTKDNIGDLHETQLEVLDIVGLEDVTSITVTLNGNKTASYFFDFSFVNGEGVEKAAVSADKNILMVGHQRSTEVVNNKMGLRFVAAIENIEGYSEIGFDVASTGKQTASVSGKSVYTSVLANDITCYALNEFGYNYLYALAINNVDTTLGVLEFEITPWAMVNGEKVTFESMTVTYNGATCID